MDQKVILLPVLLILIWTGSYFILRGLMMAAKTQKSYSQWIHAALADMFYNINEKLIFQILISTVVICAMLGFFLPGKVSQVDKRNMINKAIELNKQGEYEQASLILGEMSSIQSPLVYNELGVAYLGLKNFDLSESALRKAAKLLPHYGKAHQNLAALYTIMGRMTDVAFEETRAREAGNYHIPDHRLYNLSDNLTDQLGVRITLAMLLALGAYNLPRLVIFFLRYRRRKKFDEQLPDGLQMIANGLRAGLSIVQAIEMLVKDGKPPISQEFDMVLREHRLGSSLGEALIHLAERMPGMDTKIMVNATLILIESGGNLPEQFDTLAQTIHERKRIQLKIKAMTAEGVTQAWILALLPLFMALAFNALNREVYSLMYTTLIGWMLIILIILMETVGLYLMLKVVKVKI